MASLRSQAYCDTRPDRNSNVSPLRGAANALLSLLTAMFAARPRPLWDSTECVSCTPYSVSWKWKYRGVVQVQVATVGANRREITVGIVVYSGNRGALRKLVRCVDQEYDGLLYVDASIDRQLGPAAKTC